MRTRVAPLALGTVLLFAGCGGAHRAATTAQVNTASCEASGGTGRPTRQSCTFVLEDGRQLDCNRDFTGPTPTVPQLLRDGCRWLATLKLSSAMRAVIARIASARKCLTSRQLRAVGGPAFPSRPPDPTQPDGELVISSTHPTFIAFYTDAARANRIEPELKRADSGKHVILERRGAVTIVWTQAPAGDTRESVWRCVA